MLLRMVVLMKLQSSGKFSWKHNFFRFGTSKRQGTKSTDVPGPGETNYVNPKTGHAEELKPNSFIKEVKDLKTNKMIKLGEGRAITLPTRYTEAEKAKMRANLNKKDH